MKQLILFLFVFLFFIKKADTQTPYNDAIRLFEINIQELENIKNISTNENFQINALNHIKLPISIGKLENFIDYLKDPIQYCKNSSKNEITYKEEVEILNSIGKYLDRLSKVINTQKNTLGDKLLEEASLNQRITELENEITKLKNEITKLENEETKSENEKTELEKKKTDKVNELNKSQKDLKEKESEKEANDNIIKLLLDLSDINKDDYRNKKELKTEVSEIYFQDKVELKDMNAKIKQEQNLSGINEAALIQALANFIGKKIEENLKRDLKAIIFPEIDRYQPLFPETFIVIKDVNFRDLSSSVRTAIFRDLKNLLKNIAHLDDAKFAEIFSDDYIKIWKKSSPYIKLAYSVTEKLNSRTHPIDMFYQLRKDDLKYIGFMDSTITTDLNKYLSFIDILQESIRIYNEGELDDIWLSIKQIDKMNEREKNYFISKIYYLIKRIDEDLANDFIIKFSNNFDVEFEKFNKDLYKLTTIFGELEPQLSSLSNITTENKLADFGEYLDRISNIFDRTYDILQNSEIINFKSEYTEKYIDYIQTILNFSKAIKDGKFTSVIPSFISLAKTMGLDENRYVTNTMTYLNIYIDLVNSQTAEDMETVIEKAANTTGGHFSKIEDADTIFSNFYINAYGGFNLGYEKLLKEDKSSPVIGLAAPIGIEWIISKEQALGLLISLLDLGSIVSWRFEGDENISNTITLKQFVSPGIFLKFAPTDKSAFTILAGFQWIPSLREINKEGDRDNVFRFGVSFAYDIPLVRF